ncbi:MAG: hypothetical protein IH919_09130, partial [Deltaproteobacteria bacterium]|nr:hypothetical protein [Deltaproteobacteria bacterium]
ETSMAFDGYVRITNNSGEDYADAQIRLVVGTINLVEKVSRLAAEKLDNGHGGHGRECYCGSLKFIRWSFDS